MASKTQFESPSILQTVMSMPLRCAVSALIKFLPEGDEVESKNLKDTQLTWQGNSKGKIACWERG
jgi:hypothetical protein